MINLDIPGFGVFRLENLILDYNGTLAIDGVLISGVREKIRSLWRPFSISTSLRLTPLVLPL